MDVVRPSLGEMPEPLRRAAVEVGAKLAESGYRAWVVGGAVRDLAIGRTPHDADLATDANPDEVEALFAETVPLGKRFGTVLVKGAGLGVEVTSLRAEAGYTDARRPGLVTFGTSVEVDATRRDFTCNAMYLDARTGEFLDPVQGLADLREGVLRAVGDAQQRFTEDGLRILRLARLVSQLGLEPEAATLAGARASLDSLRGVSAERILSELSRGLESGGGASMLDLLAQLGVQGWLQPRAVDSAASDAAAIARELGGELDEALGVLLFVDPDPYGVGSREARGSVAFAGLEGLRPSKELRRAVEGIWRLCSHLEQASSAGVGVGQLRLWMREGAWAPAIALGRASCAARGADSAAWVAWQRARSAVGDEVLWPEAWVDADLLRECGCEPGPLWGELMAGGLLLQLGGEWASGEDARAWVLGQLAG